jgi:hypothetical protein
MKRRHRLTMLIVAILIANLTLLRGSPRDYIKAFYHWWYGHLDDGDGTYVF